MARRRHILLTGTAAFAGFAWWARPSDRGGPADPYFSGLASALRDLPQMPMLVIDRQRLRANLAAIRRIADAGMPLRVVVKSLPSLGLLDDVFAAWRTQRAMVFNVQQLVAMARSRPQSDLLLGKPLPPSAARHALDLAAGAAFDAARQVQWLVDTPRRLADYGALARDLGRTLNVNIEIDVGLHRGGVEDEPELAEMLRMIRAEPFLRFTGFMGYDAHLAAIPHLAGSRARAQAEAGRRFAAALEAARLALRTDGAAWTLNTAGSLTIHLHDGRGVANELSVGSAAVKPSHFDIPSLDTLHPAAFIATPVLKAMPRFRLPVGAEPVSDIAGWWDVNQRRALAIHGGHWLADPVSPPGVQASGLYGVSSNQQVMAVPASTPIEAGDWLLLRPRQSEAVFTQFESIAVVDGGKLVAQWPVLPASP